MRPEDVDGDFQDLRIVGVDKKLTGNADPSQPLYDVYLELSADPPDAWDRLFEQQRLHPRHGNWRRARIAGRHLIIACLLTELEANHRELKQDVAEANAAYRSGLRDALRHEAQDLEAAEQERRDKDAVLDRLDFEP